MFRPVERGLGMADQLAATSLIHFLHSTLPLTRHIPFISLVALLLLLPLFDLRIRLRILWRTATTRRNEARLNRPTPHSWHSTQNAFTILNEEGL